jgi:hypothetical protein
MSTTPEGRAKDAILLANGCMPVQRLALYKNFTGFITYGEQTTGKRRGYRVGLTKTGSSDLVGPTTITITPEMVGKQVAVFSVFEVKRPDQPPKPTPDQILFIDNITARGGIAGVVQKPEDVRDIICNWESNLRRKK